MSNYMSHDDAYRVLDSAHFATDTLGCIEGIAEALGQHIRVMTIVDCAGAALYPINQVLERCCSAHLETSSNGGGSSSGGHWTVRVFNTDDWGGAFLNERWDNAVVEADYGGDSGRVDITSRMTSGDNLLVLGNWNNSGGYAWGFQIAYNSTTVWDSHGGQQGVQGANNDDRSRTYQYTHTEWLVLHSDGTVTTR
jgi:hypothetical protein